MVPEVDPDCKVGPKCLLAKSQRSKAVKGLEGNNFCKSTYAFSSLNKLENPKSVFSASLCASLESRNPCTHFDPGSLCALYTQNSAIEFHMVRDWPTWQVSIAMGGGKGVVLMGV
ncbi:hypothetical protein Tco_0004597 [Tanacetum coccineum]